MNRILLVSTLFLSVIGSASASDGGRLMRLAASEVPDLIDDADTAGLSRAVESSLEYYAPMASTASLAFGAGSVTVGKMTEGLRHFQKILGRSGSPRDINERIRKDFDVYRAEVGGKSGAVTFSSYFAPSISAKLSPDSEYRYPIYSRPPDLADLYWEDFDPARKGERMAVRFDGRKLVPYFSRGDIDSKKVLAGRNLEIAWAKNPLDVLTLQIQGSGWVNVPGGTESYHIRYAGDNGLKYASIGLSLIESGAIPKAEFNKDRMWAYLNGLDGEKRQAILNRNPRYIFFELTSPTTSVRGSLMVSLTDGRSIATDPRIYPPGALAFIKTQRPAFDSDLKPRGAEPMTRFVLNQDEGGAIKSWNRVDFYSGHGALAEKTAERLWYPGELYFFIKKP